MGKIKDTKRTLRLKMKKLIRKRAREYNSDDDGGEDDDIQPGVTNNVIEDDKESNESSDDEEAGGRVAWNSTTGDMNNDIPQDEEEDGDIQPGITKFTEGCRAFRMAFRNIMKKSVSVDSLGPVLSGHKKLIADKLVEDQRRLSTM